MKRQIDEHLYLENRIKFSYKAHIDIVYDTMI